MIPSVIWQEDATLGKLAYYRESFIRAVVEAIEEHMENENAIMKSADRAQLTVIFLEMLQNKTEPYEIKDAIKELFAKLTVAKDKYNEKRRVG
jgi:hypothetical protein